MPDIRHIKPTTYAELVAQAAAIWTPESVAAANARNENFPVRSALGPDVTVEGMRKFHIEMGLTANIIADREARRRAYYRSQGWE